MMGQGVTLFPTISNVNPRSIFGYPWHYVGKDVSVLHYSFFQLKVKQKSRFPTELSLARMGRNGATIFSEIFGYSRADIFKRFSPFLVSPLPDLIARESRLFLRLSLFVSLSFPGFPFFSSKHRMYEMVRELTIMFLVPWDPVGLLFSTFQSLLIFVFTCNDQGL